MPQTLNAGNQKKMTQPKKNKYFTPDEIAKRLTEQHDFALGSGGMLTATARHAALGREKSPPPPRAGELQTDLNDLTLMVDDYINQGITPTPESLDPLLDRIQAILSEKSAS